MAKSHKRKVGVDVTTKKGAQPKILYSDEDKAKVLLALDANGGNLSRTAQETGVNFDTIMAWRDGACHPDVYAIRAGRCASLADRLEEAAHIVLTEALQPDKLAEAGFRDMTAGMGVIIDKMRLLREQATNISQQAGLSDEERLRRLRALFDKGKKPGVVIEQPQLPAPQQQQLLKEMPEKEDSGGHQAGV